MSSELDEDEYYHDSNSEDESDAEVEDSESEIENDSEDNGGASDESSDDDAATSAPAARVWVKSTNFKPNIPPCSYEVTVMELGQLQYSSTPLDVLRNIINDDMIEEIRTETNRYAGQLKLAKPSALSRWEEVSTADLWAFLGLQLLMGIDKKPSYKDYWSTNPILHSPIFSSTMPRDRFLSILRALHFTNNEEQEAGSHRLNKLGNFLPHVMRRFEEIIEPGEFLCVDETLLLFKGRLSFLQYIPSKRARFGIKFFVLVDCETKFVVAILPYTGKSTRLSQDLIKDLGYGGAIVRTLMDKYLDERRKVVVDNFFASPILADNLLSRSTYILGTVRANRKEMPKMQVKLKRGEVEAYHTDNLMVERWCDRRVVHMINNFMGHEMKDAIAKRYVKKDGTVNPAKQKPSSVLLYNSTMGGVDDVDRQIQPYVTERKTTKWYRKVAFHILDLCVYNAFILYKYIRGGIKMEYKPFLQELISELLQKFRVPRAKFGRPIKFPIPDEDRLKGSHVPTLQVNSSGTVRRLECYLCKAKGHRRLTQFECKTCSVSLCVKPIKIKNALNAKNGVLKSCCELYHTLKVLPRKKK